MPRSRHLFPLIILTVIIGGLSVAGALLIDWTPLEASEQAERINPLLWFVIWASIVIFTGVTVVVIYAAWRFRAKPGDESDGPPIHGNTRLEVIWTIVPTILLVVMAVWAYLVLADNEALASDRLVVDVTAQQFAWEYVYPDGQIGTGDLRVPVGRQVELRMRSRDVIHDFYVVEFSVKQDVVPGITTKLVFNPNKVGTYQVICAELCGVGHAGMRSRVIVMQPAAFDAWMVRAKATLARRAAAANAPRAGSRSTTPAAPAAPADAQP